MKFRNIMNPRTELFGEIKSPDRDFSQEIVSGLSISRKKTLTKPLDRTYYVQPTKEQYLNDFNSSDGFEVALKILEYDRSQYIDVVQSDFFELLLKQANQQEEEGEKGLDSKEDTNSTEPSDVRVFQFFSKSNPEILTIRLETVFKNATLRMIFFTEYWMLNETSFPLALKFQEGRFAYDPISIDPSNPENPNNPVTLDQSDFTMRADLLDQLTDRSTTTVNMKKSVSERNVPTIFDSARLKHGVGLFGMKPAKVTDNSVKIEDLERGFFCLRCSQFSSKYLESLLESKGPALKFFTGNPGEENKSLRVKIERLTDWCDEYSLHEGGTISPYIELHRKMTRNENKDDPQNLFELCLNFVELPGKFNRTKLLIISPKYLIMNMTDFPFSVHQTIQSKQLLAKVPTQSVAPLHWSFAQKSKSIFLKVEKQGFGWSAAFDVEHNTNLTIKLKNMVDSESLILNLEVTAFFLFY